MTGKGRVMGWKKVGYIVDGKKRDFDQTEILEAIG